MNIFKKDSFILGGVLASIAPAIVYSILSALVKVLSEKYTQGIPLITEHNIILVSVFLNMLIFTTYIHKAPYDKTGRGVMLITFIYTGIYFIWRFQQFMD
ncbi:MAG: hypothetical protein B6I18_02490 [Bacteroidetes bacterium 4572_112]|nr:MAG: hypothetical protein B6I18_02490 [Bacteroidetes bacterium 4572_112]